MTAKLLAILLLSSVMSSSASEGGKGLADIDGRKRAFLTQLADNWLRAGAPVKWVHEEWKFDEIEPNWAGALAAMALKRSDG
jgi:hypothetical protein